MVAAQGLRVRRGVEVLPEASGARTGRVEGTGPEVRVVVIGESTAAGCGVATHDEGFAGALAGALSAADGRAVAWEVCGASGATLQRIRDELVPQLRGVADVAVLLAGVNDVLTRRSPAQWADDLKSTLELVAAHAVTTVVAGVPPFEAFPALPRTLARFLAQRARSFDAASAEVCAARLNTQWIRTEGLVPLEPAFFARDGFHPSAAGYATWAEGIAHHLGRS